MPVDETTSWTDDYNERNNPFTGPIDTADFTSIMNRIAVSPSGFGFELELRDNVSSTSVSAR
jgi:hypothetical protein